jgi:hypothetical protein
MRDAFLLIMMAFVVVNGREVARAELSVSLTLDHEIRYQFPEGNSIRLRFEGGEVEFVDAANKVVQMLSLKADCRAGTEKFFEDFQQSYRRGRVLEEPDLVRPDSVLVRESKDGMLLKERYDRSSHYARFLRKVEIRFPLIAKSSVIPCLKARPVAK